MNNFEQFTSLQQTFKEQLSIDKKYQPIFKSLAGLLKTIKPQTTEVFNHLKVLDKTYAQQVLNLSNQYNRFLENVDRSEQIAIKKHQKWVESTQKQKNQDTTILQNEMRLKLEAIDDDIEKNKIEQSTEIVKLETVYKRETASIQKTTDDLKKTYEKQTEIIEIEKAETLKKLKLVYDQKIKSLDEQLSALDQTLEETLLKLKEDHDQKIVLSDDQYLQIKNDYTQLSIHLNQKINDIKKVYQKDMEEFKQHFERDAKPLMKSIEALKAEYKLAQQKCLDGYQEKLSALNNLFDQQKTNYEAKKQRIINEINGAITLLNSKLSAFREGIQKDKLQTSRTMRQEMKEMSAEDEHKHNKALKRALTQYDNDLNRQIIRTQKDIDLKHVLMQKKLFEHDQNHLKEVNDWRLTKEIYSYEHKQELAKLELNYNYNLNDLNLQLKRLSLLYEFDKEKRLLNHNRNLLPLEFQLTIGSLVQERELNLLSNDKHQVHDDYQHEIKIKQLEYKLNQTELQYDQKIAKAHYASEEAVLLTMSQLELQKEKLKYETGLLEMSLRREIQDAILAKNKEAIDHERVLSERHLTLSKHKIEADTKKQVSNLNQDIIALYQRQTNHLENLKLRTLHLKSIRKTERIQKLLAFELEKQQVQLELLINHQFFITNHFNTYIGSIEKLYLIPAHPELFKSYLQNVTILCETYHQLCMEVLNHFKAIDLGYHQNKIEDQSSHRGQLKFDHELNILNHQSGRAEKIKDELYKEVKQLGSQILSLQTMIEKESQTIKTLSETLQATKPSQAKQQEMLSHIKDKEKTVQKLSQNRNQLDQRITQLHKKIVPIDDKLARIEHKKSLLSDKYKKERSTHQHYFAKSLNRTTSYYEKMEQRITHFKQMMQTFIKSLSGEAYVTDSKLKETKKIILKQQDHLNHMLLITYQKLLTQAKSNYDHQKTIQEKVTHKFKHALQKALKQQKHTYLEQVKLQKRKYHSQVAHINETYQGISQQIHKEISTYKTSYQMRLHEFVESIRSSEKKLEIEGLKFQNELKLLNENQVDVAKSYQHDHEQVLAGIHKALSKDKESILAETDALLKSHQEYQLSTEHKNKALITKYETSHQKQVELLKAKKLHYINRIKKETKHKDKKLSDLNIEKDMQTQKRTDELKHMRIHLERFKLDAKNAQNHSLRKELGTLKKSYRFKVRALKLKT